MRSVTFTQLIMIFVMNRIIVFAAILFFAFANSAQAQNPGYPYGLSVKNLFMDYQSQNGGDFSNFSNYHSGFEISAQKNINDKVNVVLPIKYGVVRDLNSESDMVHKRILGVDIQGQYHLYKPERRVNFYAMAGVGGVTESEGEFNMQIPFGLGVNFKISDKAYINWQSEYRYSLKEDRNNLHHGLGFTFLIGTKAEMTDMTEEEKQKENMVDSDNDGLEDDIDLCPQIYGPKELKGCPDRDEDGIPDYRDDCPSIKGLAVFKGCPDTDQDGISDNDDECPNLQGTKSNNGCPEDNKGDDGDMNKDDDAVTSEPDSDGDGVVDSEDSCPNSKGSATANGCPDADGDGIPDHEDKCVNAAGLKVMNGCPDSDGDGIDDSRDKCPNTKGTVDANGCPGISDSDRTILETAMRAVQFDTGKATLKPSSYPVLNQISNIMERYPNYNLVIEGHTDNVGNAENNQLLSENRAKACFDYLARRGTNSSRMSYSGYGEAQPIANNNSLTGRELNRRVEFNLVPK